MYYDHQNGTSRKHVTYSQPRVATFDGEGDESSEYYDYEYEDPKVEKLKKKIKSLEKELKQKNMDLKSEKEKSNVLST